MTIVSGNGNKAFAKMLRIPLFKCFLAHEEVDDGNLDFCKEIAISMIDLGINNIEVLILATIEYDAIYFMVKKMVRDVVSSLRLAPVKGLDAIAMYTLCKLEMSLNGLHQDSECLQFLSSIATARNDALFLHRFIQFDIHRWSDDTRDVEKAWEGFRLERARLLALARISIVEHDSKLRISVNTADW